MHDLAQNRNNAERGAERALFLRRTAQNGNFRRTQKGAERRASLEETLCGGRNLDKLIRLSKYFITDFGLFCSSPP